MNNISKTAQDSPIEIVDFTIGRDLVPFAETRYEATVFLVSTNVEKGRLLARTIAATIEEGIVFDYMFEQFQAQGESWETWVTEQTPYDPDTARHYRNVANKFRETIVNYDDDVLTRVNLTALYKLAIQDVPIDTALRFFDMLVRNPELKGDTKLAVIVSNPEIAARYEKHELTKNQAYDLVIALKDKFLNPFIKQLCLTEKINYAGVVTYLNKTYYDWIRQSDTVRPNKSWADIVNHNYRLVWQDTNAEYEIHISEVTPQDCMAYRNFRQVQHITDSRQDLTQSRATANVKRNKDGSITLTLLDSKALPIDFDSGTILIDLLPETLERKEE